MSAADLTLARVLAMGPVGAHRIPGSTLGPYVIEAELGRGAFGIVARARPRAGGAPVAIKALLAGADATVSQRRRFEREALLGEAIAHDHVVKVVDAGEEQGLLWIAMELVEGRTLKQVFDEGRPAVAEAVRLVREVAAGLAAAHARGVVHRDLKPENVLVRASDGRALLTDFGLARELDLRSSLTRTGALLGTPAYMAPEQIKGKPATMATDVFALGAILYQGLAGRSPFSGQLAVRYAEILGKPPAPPSQEAPGVSPALDAVVLRALAAKPEERFADAGAFLAALDAAVGDDGSAAHGGGRRVLVLVAAIVGALALALVGAVVARLTAGPATRPAPAPATSPARVEPRRPPTVDELWARAKAPELEAGARREALAALLRARPDHAEALALWDGLRGWERLTPPASPPGRDAAGRLVWDPARRVLLLFGGWAGEPARLFDDLWAWDGERWTELAVGADRPPPRHGHALAWDEARGQLMLHGGLRDGAHRVTEDAWSWDGATWTRIGMIAGPEARCWSALEWDPERRTVVSICGRVLGPPDRRFVAQDDTWEWNGDTWVALLPRERPPARWAMASVVDGPRRRLVIFGGRSEDGLLDDLWAFKDGAWAPLEPSGTRPSPRQAAAFVLDGRGRAVLHGGAGPEGFLDDTWLLDLKTERWTRLAPPTSPGPRAWHAAGYDPVRRCVVLFGGQTSAGRIDDLWVLRDAPP